MTDLVFRVDRDSASIGVGHNEAYFSVGYGIRDGGSDFAQGLLFGGLTFENG